MVFCVCVHIAVATCVYATVIHVHTYIRTMCHSHKAIHVCAIVMYAHTHEAI